MFVRNGTSELKKVLICPPTYLEEAAPINEISKKYADQPLDREKLSAEFEQLVEAYHQAGIKVEQQTATPEMTNAVFARDFGGCVKEGYFEGGDFAFLTEKIIAVGIIDRTNEKGFEEIQAGLAPLGYEVYPVPADPRYLHLDMCFNLVDDHLAVAYKEGLPESFLQLLAKLEIEIILVPEEAIFKHGCNLESLGAKRVLSLKQNTAVNQSLRSHGMKVIELDITETLKAGGGPHCMTFPLQRG